MNRHTRLNMSFLFLFWAHPAPPNLRFSGAGPGYQPLGLAIRRRIHAPLYSLPCRKARSSELSAPIPRLYLRGKASGISASRRAARAKALTPFFQDACLYRAPGECCIFQTTALEGLLYCASCAFPPAAFFRCSESGTPAARDFSRLCRP